MNFFVKSGEFDGSRLRFGRIFVSFFAALFVLATIMSSISVVPEGHVGIVKTFSKATDQIDPGLNFKTPFITSVEMIEVRQRKNVEELTGATKNQLPITAQVSINWTVEKSSALVLFKDYGGLDQFESRILDPKLRSSAKAALARFPADRLIRERELAVNTILEEMGQAMEDFPVVINSPQIENISLPSRYLQAVEEKETAREAAEREKHNLDRQRLEAQQKVNTANAERDALKAHADGRAYQIRIEAEAEAAAIEIINAQLAKSDNYVDLVRAQAWNGVLPTTLITDGGEGKSLLMQVK